MGVCVWEKYGIPALHKYIKLIVVNKSLLNKKLSRRAVMKT